MEKIMIMPEQHQVLVLLFECGVRLVRQTAAGWIAATKEGGATHRLIVRQQKSRHFLIASPL